MPVLEERERDETLHLPRRAQEEHTALERESSDVDDDLGPGLEDDEEDSDRASDSIQLELVVQLPCVRDLVGRARQRNYIRNPCEKRLELGLGLEGEPRVERR